MRKMRLKGSVIARPARADGTIPYQSIVKVRGQKAFTKTFDTKSKAQKHNDSVRADVVAHIEARETKRRTEAAMSLGALREEKLQALHDSTIAGILRDYKASEDCTRRDLNSVETVIYYLRDVTVGTIDTGYLRSYVDILRGTATQRGTQFSYATLKGHISLMRRAIHWRADALRLPMPFFPSTKNLFPRGWDVKRKRRLSEAEERAIRAKFRSMRGLARHYWKHLLTLALETGTRQAELVEAPWSEFDLEAGNWRIDMIRTKSLEDRDIPLTQRAKRSLRMLKLIDGPDEPLLFPNFSSAASVCALFRRFCREDCGIKGLRYHDIRHEALTRMTLKVIREGKGTAALFVVMAIAGHKKMSMMKRYVNFEAIDLKGFLD